MLNILILLFFNDSKKIIRLYLLKLDKTFKIWELVLSLLVLMKQKFENLVGIKMLNM